MPSDLEHQPCQSRPPTKNSVPETALEATTGSRTSGIRTGSKSMTNSEMNKNVLITDKDEEECKTPTAEENKIPKLTSPPPAPRKKRVRNEDISCKKKLMPEFENAVRFTVRFEDLEKVFRSRFDDLDEEERLRLRRKVLLPSS